jgi:hypothetical protein
MSEAAAKRLSASDALAIIERAQKVHPGQEWRLTVAINNPGGLSAHQTVEVEAMYSGFDWTAGQIIVRPTQPVSMLTPEQVAAVVESVRKGNSWHAYQRDRKSHARIKELEEELRGLRASLAARAPEPRAAVGEVASTAQDTLELPTRWLEGVGEAFGYLWHVNTEPGAPVTLFAPEAAAFEARKRLAELLTHEQRGQAINKVGRSIGRYVDEDQAHE